MEYIPGNTTKTTLSIGGVNQINATAQYTHLTGNYMVVQQPCISDTTAPIFNVSIPSAGTKKSYLSGITVSLTDNVGVAGTEVPYIRSGGTWTGNTWGITNQFGINLLSFVISISGNN